VLIVNQIRTHQLPRATKLYEFYM